MFSLTPKGHENVSEKLSFGTWFGTQTGKTTVLERIEKREKKHIGNVTQMSPKGTTFSPGNLLEFALWGHKNENRARGVDIVRLAPKMVPRGLKMRLELSKQNELRGTVAVLGAHATVDITWQSMARLHRARIRAMGSIS